MYVIMMLFIFAGFLSLQIWLYAALMIVTTIFDLFNAPALTDAPSPLLKWKKKLTLDW